MLEGLPPNNAAHVMRLVCDEDTARSVADLVVETFDPAETAASAFEETANTRDWNVGPWVVEVYFGEAPDEEIVRELVAVVAGPELAAQATFGNIAQRDWVSTALDGLAILFLRLHAKEPRDFQTGVAKTVVARRFAHDGAGIQDPLRRHHAR